MTNNDRLLQIISNIQILNDLTKSMIDSEMYPVSFFSQACDLMQKIQGDFHTIEAEQVEMFAAQLKKHQELIFSIHQQMRYIQPQNLERFMSEPTVSPTKKAVPPKPAAAPIKEAVQPKPTVETVKEAVPPEPKVEPIKEAAQPKPTVETVKEVVPPEPKVEPIKEAAQPEPTVATVQPDTDTPPLPLSTSH